MGFQGRSWGVRGVKGASGWVRGNLSFFGGLRGNRGVLGGVQEALEGLRGHWGVHGALGILWHGNMSPFSIMGLTFPELFWCTNKLLTAHHYQKTLVALFWPLLE